MSEVWNKVYKSDSSFFGGEPSNFALLCLNHMKTNNAKRVLELGAVFLKIKCDYCDNDMFRGTKLLRVGQYERYFCCNSCLTLYKQKYRSKIEAMSR